MNKNNESKIEIVNIKVNLEHFLILFVCEQQDASFWDYGPLLLVDYTSLNLLTYRGASYLGERYIKMDFQLILLMLQNTMPIMEEVGSENCEWVKVKVKIFK
jgi:hypothetical protein